MDVKKMEGDVARWINHLLPKEERDSMNTCIKLTEEVSELMHAIHTGDGNIGEECADVLILLLDVAYLNNINLQQEFLTKMAKNYGRQWNRKNGALKHVHND
jgi:NTP pyrophosphatase (non-canonical NTP hydrolase)